MTQTQILRFFVQGKTDSLGSRPFPNCFSSKGDSHIAAFLKGEICGNSSWKILSATFPNQIKSATDNLGTFTESNLLNCAPAALLSGSSLDEARAIVHSLMYGKFRKIAQKLEQSLGGKDAPQAAQRLAAIARLHARAGAAERGANPKGSSRISQAGNLGDLSQTPSINYAPAINDPTVSPPRPHARQPPARPTP
jgi:hypothetical protein